MKILAVDPGLRKIGLAVSDPTGTAARALEVFRPGSLRQACEKILEAVRREQAGRILIGRSGGPDSVPDDLTRFTHRLLADLRAAASVPVDLYDESFSTARAREIRLIRGERRKARRAEDDSLAAAAFLQEYLDAQAESQP
ncbi:MAG: Holliday junction resolvase RuvX [Anaerolineales bacterium]|nr:Holliday junction resolvase RuvX [Anaerolineales bacterium]